ncbi:hypothetical protein [Nitrospirillum amazonense]|uniref:hypothetical protein n=1 Tax=Nitrospirillum amazonense TaxID=28077 RepID=UPI002412E6E9|nr:hypothetical protein [Nitrospirillum amazonense]MDG3442618.1 hypothetical protein [Nitrospirillum amazonense]
MAVATAARSLTMPLANDHLPAFGPIQPRLKVAEGLVPDHFPKVGNNLPDINQGEDAPFNGRDDDGFRFGRSVPS